MADPAPLCFRSLPGRWLPRWFRPVRWKGAACPLASLRFRKPQTTACLLRTVLRLPFIWEQIKPFGLWEGPQNSLSLVLYSGSLLPW